MSEREDAERVNELIEVVADFADQKAEEIRRLVNDEVRSGSFLMDGENAADDLVKAAKDIRDFTLDYDSY